MVNALLIINKRDPQVERSMGLFETQVSGMESHYVRMYYRSLLSKLY